ncbi:MAG: hypothetical protein WCL50_09095 [Spirochaetota bacterium]
MSRTISIFLFLVILGSSSFAQLMGDARAAGLAGAMTAVGDDMNALFYNPAGLAFVRKGYVSVEGNVDIAFNQSIMSSFSNAMPRIYSYYDERNHPVYVYDDLKGQRQHPFVFGTDDKPYLAELEALAKADGQAGYSGLTDTMKSVYLKNLESANSLYNVLESFVAHPRAIVGGHGWGASGFADYALTPQYSAGTIFDKASLEYRTDRRIGAIAGIGLSLGPVAVGGNAKYIQDAVYSESFSAIGPAAWDLNEVIKHDVSVGGYENSRVELGLGAILTLGTLNLGAYNDNVIPFLNKQITAPFIESFLNTMNFGLSWMPLDNKFLAKKSLFVLMTTADFKNVGDVRNRQLCAGVEAGLNAFDLFEALVRIGYTQRLPGSYAEMASAFKPANGIVTVGVTAKVLVLKLDAAYVIPVSAIGTYVWTDTDRAKDFMKFNLTAALGL